MDTSFHEVDDINTQAVALEKKHSDKLAAFKEVAGKIGRIGS